MITHLNIQGLAIIESLDIEFSPGFNVITGETGAGKSILIKALNLLMGAKAGADLVRKGRPSATVSAEFSVSPGHVVLKALEELGIPFEPGGRIEVLIRRQITDKGRSSAWINDTPVTTTALKRVAIALIDVFGQHENQKLLDAARHVDYLDAFVQPPEVRAAMAQAWDAFALTFSEWRDRVVGFCSREKDADYNRYRLEELAEFDPAVEDFEQTRSFCDKVEHCEAVKDCLDRAVKALEGDGESSGAGPLVWEGYHSLSRLPKATRPDELLGRFHRAASEIDDLAFEVGRLLGEVDFDATELEKKQARLFGYQDLFRKHSVGEIESLIAVRDQLAEALDQTENFERHLEELGRALVDRATTLAQAASALGEARRAAARKIRKLVESELAELVMPGAVFDVLLEPYHKTASEPDLSAFGVQVQEYGEKARRLTQSIGEKGAERVQFLLSANAGEAARPLNQVASGGEVSRIMLALKKALAADAETCVLVFDEIDTGISGRVADVVGRKMRELANRFQVLCVSHLPQVAVHADAHFLVEKKGSANRTQSTILRLSVEKSAEEIARLLSGEEVSKISLANAKSLIARAKQAKGLRPAKTRVRPVEKRP